MLIFYSGGVLLPTPPSPHGFAAQIREGPESTSAVPSHVAPKVRQHAQSPRYGRHRPITLVKQSGAKFLGRTVGALISMVGWGREFPLRSYNADSPHMCEGYLVVLLWRCATLPHRRQCSTIADIRLSFRVRNGIGRFPDSMDTAKLARCGLEAGKRMRRTKGAQTSRVLILWTQPKL